MVNVMKRFDISQDGGAGSIIAACLAKSLSQFQVLLIEKGSDNRE